MVLAISKMKLDFQIDNWTSKLSIRKAKVLIIRSVHSTKVLVVVPTKVGPILQTLSVRACARTRTRAGAAIFVHSGAEGAYKMCVRVRAYYTFLVRTCADVRRTSPRPFFIINQYKFMKKKIIFF